MALLYILSFALTDDKDEFSAQFGATLLIRVIDCMAFALSRGENQKLAYQKFSSKDATGSDELTPKENRCSL